MASGIRVWDDRTTFFSYCVTNFRLLYFIMKSNMWRGKRDKGKERKWAIKMYLIQSNKQTVCQLALMWIVLPKRGSKFHRTTIFWLFTIKRQLDGQTDRLAGGQADILPVFSRYPDRCCVQKCNELFIANVAQHLRTSHHLQNFLYCSLK